MSKIHLLRLLPFGLIVLCFSACSDHPTLIIGSNQWPGYEPVYLARDLGLFTRDEINLVELPSSTDVMQHLRNHNLDGGMLSLDEVIKLVAEGIPMSVILVLDISHGADAVMAQPEIKTLDDLKGKRVGVELSALGALMLEYLLEAAKLTPGDLEIKPITVDQHEAAFVAREVDAVITFEPTRSRLLSLQAVELINSSLIPGRIVDVLAVRRDVLKDHAKQLRKLIDSYFTARQYIDEHPRIAAKRMAPRLNIDRELLLEIYQGLILLSLQENREWLAGQPPLLFDNAEKLAQRMLKHKLIPSKPHLDQLANSQFLPEK